MSLNIRPRVAFIIILITLVLQMTFANVPAPQTSSDNPVQTFYAVNWNSIRGRK